MPRSTLFAFVLAVLALQQPAVAQEPQHPDVIERAFTAGHGDGSLTAAEAALHAHLSGNPRDEDARFALAIVRFLLTGERLSQSLYRHGGFNTVALASMMTGLGGVNQGVAANPDPQPITHQQFEAIIRAWLDDVAAVERTLADVRADRVQVRARLGLTRFDLNADGVASGDEELWRLFRIVQNAFRPNRQNAAEFVIAFDRGDAEWLRGYCRICMAFGEFLLAHDTRDLFERAGHVFFPANVTPHEYLKGPRKPFDFETGVDATDVIALVHLLSFEVEEPARLEAARTHLLAAVAHSRAMWRHFDAETDDDREWIPNPRQTAAIPGARVDEDMREAWLLGLDEAEALLEGRRLLRFWRGDGSRGINVRRVFAEPRRFDLVLWVQGSAAGPYLEEGEFTADGTWNRMVRAFEGQVFRHAWWFN
ncbi:MAG: hypothetical protein KIS87_06765 [Phycisphaeraceae bacterium]|nr:hypothetical protein [Phycisphaeraceae bacterium]